MIFAVWHIQEPSQINQYDCNFQALLSSAGSELDAAIQVAEAYLGGKPARRGKHKVAQVERDFAFWSAGFLKAMGPEFWATDVMKLSLARYLDQARVSNTDLLAHVALIEPETVCCAVRYARMAINPKPVRRDELEEAGRLAPAVLEQCKIIDIFDRAHRERCAELQARQAAFCDMSAFELLIYASLYAFEYVVPGEFDVPSWESSARSRVETTWYAINDLLIWKLKTAPASSIKLSEHQLGQSLATHLSPFLFPSTTGSIPRHDLRLAFEQLLAAQVELNEFIDRSVDAYSYDDAIRFVRYGAQLEIEETNQAVRDQWQRDGKKLSLLHGYWFYRAFEQFASSEMATQQIGSRENHEANRLAYIRTMRNQLQLDEVYGIDESVMIESGERVNLFQALLSLELTSAFFQRDFLQRYAELLRDAGDWQAAAGKLAWDGLVEGSQNRFPLTWSSREEKIRSIVGWTVDQQNPKGSLSMAASIIDFWSNDWSALAARLGREEPGLHPELFERPFLKLGQFLVQLPWVTGLQNNSTAAINNLRRIGARRVESRDETRRIEENLGKLFESRGFRVTMNWHPDAEWYPSVGEIDLICSSGGTVLVIEVKSTFLRHSQRDAWLHGKTTLRRAGRQLRRKVGAVQHVIQEDPQTCAMLGIESGTARTDVRGWIIDTSIEHDHQRFDGFLKVSVEETIIALRDDRHLLNDPSGILSGKILHAQYDEATNELPFASLYPEGFSASRFVEVIESEAVWGEVFQNS